MTDLELLIALQRQNSGSLGFIPRDTLRDRYVRNGQYLISTHRSAGKVGFLLFGPPRRYEVLHITQCCLQLDYRRRHRAKDLVERLKKIATDAGCTEIQLRCAVQLEANAFWREIGSRLIGTYDPETPTSSRIHHYAIDLDTDAYPLFKGLSPCRPNLERSPFSPQHFSGEEPSESLSVLPASSIPQGTK